MDFDAPAHVVRALVASAMAEDIGPLGDLTASLVAIGTDASVDVIVTDPAYSGMNRHMMFGNGRIVGEARHACNN